MFERNGSHTLDHSKWEVLPTAKQKKNRRKLEGSFPQGESLHGSNLLRCETVLQFSKVKNYCIPP